MLAGLMWYIIQCKTWVKFECKSTYSCQIDAVGTISSSPRERGLTVVGLGAVDTHDL